MITFDSKVQIEILEEVLQKSDSTTPCDTKTPIAVDITDPVRSLNFENLCSDGCFLFFSGSSQQSPTDYAHVRSGCAANMVYGLSCTGHGRYKELVEKSKMEVLLFKKIELQAEHVSALLEQVSAIKEGNKSTELTANKAIKSARCGNIWTAVAAIIAFFALIRPDMPTMHNAILLCYDWICKLTLFKL